MSRPRRRTQVFQWIQISVLKNGLAEAFHKGLITPEGTHINVCDFRGGYLASRNILEAGRAAGSRWRCKRPGDQFMIAEIFPGNVSLPDRVPGRRNLNDSASAIRHADRGPQAYFQPGQVLAMRKGLSLAQIGAATGLPNTTMRRVG
jgi:hypothetical protein